uniref:GTPase activating protein n=1 Tax=Kwoniella dejecticola CBS 10117 TaxID=1296121 RepID=A0A1A5ZXY3_9TREE|nr:GTPase activating protein [Kwoniella dejecticola CBS 10117]OBR82672.1 GTPase activating protein [Kwoniella dejecticola CBS 10117]
MAPVTLPPSFYNSFWSPDYRSGLEVLFKSLEQGCLENDDVDAFIESQIKSHLILSQSLLNPPLPTVSPESSSSLQHTLLSLRGASSARGEAHRALAQELEQRVLAGFKSWKERHEVRVKEARTDMLGKGGVVGFWEKENGKLANLHQTYVNKTRAADDSEDDAKFAPATARSPPPDNYTTSPKVHHKSPGALRRAGTVADRISEKLRAASIQSAPSALPSSPSRHRPVLSIDGKELPPPPSPLLPVISSPDGLTSPTSPTREERFVPPTDPDGKPFIHSAIGGPPVPSKAPVTPGREEPFLLSGLSLSSQALKSLIQRFDTYLLTNLAPYSDAPFSQSNRSNAALASRQRSTILGTYEKTFSGEEVVEWLKENVEGFGGDWERCVEASTELYKLGHFSRIGVGRGFDSSEDAYYVLKSNQQQAHTAGNTFGNVNIEKANEALHSMGISSPLSPSTATNALPSLLKSYLPASLGNSDEPHHVRLRKEASKADEAYKEGVRNAEERRLEMEESIEKGLRLWERWERERLVAVKTVLKHYDEALAKLPDRLTQLQKGTSLGVEAFNPEADIKALIEGNRTGPFRPRPHVYESLETDIPDVNFGIDLRRWSGEHGWKSLVSAPPRPKGAIPEAVEALLGALTEMYQGVPDDERRRSWIYEVPFNETHMLRNAINNPQIPMDDLIAIVKKFNLPIAAGTLKLYLLELNPPVLGWEGWEDAKAVYPAIGADQERDMTNAVSSVLGRLPGSQLYVLDAVIKHFRNLIDSTKSAESDEVYVTKLALSVGRTILRPQYETDLTIGDRTPSLFLADLINHYAALFPTLIEKKKKEADRVMPTRKRTALVDQRISRSSLSGADKDPQQLLELQHALQHPSQSQPPRAASPSPTSKVAAPPHLGSALGFGPPLENVAQQSPAPPSQTSKEAQPATSQIPPKNANASDDRPPTFIEPADDDDDRPPVFKEPKSDSRPVTPTEGFVPPPTAHDPSKSATRSSTPTDSFRPPNGAAQNTDARAPTPSAGKDGEDSVIAAGAGSGGLKRATSGETSRLRGPRGARGPRPAGGRVPSHTGTPSITSIVTSYADDSTDPATQGRSESPAIPDSAGLGVNRSRENSRPTSPAAGATPTSATGDGSSGLKRASRTNVSLVCHPGV